MQIVIELDKEDYEKIKKTSFVENTETMLNQSSEDRKGTMMLFRVIDAIKNGTPLPKGHGRLIDADAIVMPILETEADEKWVSIAINSAQTIIEADTESEEL